MKIAPTPIERDSAKMPDLLQIRSQPEPIVAIDVSQQKDYQTWAQIDATNISAMCTWKKYPLIIVSVPHTSSVEVMKIDPTPVKRTAAKMPDPGQLCCIQPDNG